MASEETVTLTKERSTMPSSAAMTSLRTGWPLWTRTMGLVCPTKLLSP